MKRLKLENNQINFIGSWKLDNDEISKNIINFFENNIDLQKDGSTGDGKKPNIKRKGCNGKIIHPIPKQ